MLLWRAFALNKFVEGTPNYRGVLYSTAVLETITGVSEWTDLNGNDFKLVVVAEFEVFVNLIS